MYLIKLQLICNLKITFSSIHREEKGSDLGSELNMGPLIYGMDTLPCNLEPSVNSKSS